jgi:hypothetical protein
MNIRARFKEIVEEMYQPKPIATYLLGRIADIISTYYLCVEKNSPAIKLNAVVRNLFYELGAENAVVAWFTLSLLPIPVFYTCSKIVGELIGTLTTKGKKIWKKYYTGLLYGSSAISFLCSINNSLVYFDLPHIPGEHLGVIGGILFALVYLYNFRFRWDMDED